MANLDLDEFKRLLKSTEQQIVVMLDLTSIKAELMDFIEVQMEVSFIENGKIFETIEHLRFISGKRNERIGSFSL